MKDLDLRGPSVRDLQGEWLCSQKFLFFWNLRTIVFIDFFHGEYKARFLESKMFQVIIMGKKKVGMTLRLSRAGVDLKIFMMV
jgi:hypothetical protein